MANEKPCKVVNTPRTVIEGQLLAALDDKTKVALLIVEEDLTMLINALEQNHQPSPAKVEEFATDLRQLRREAFGK